MSAYICEKCGKSFERARKGPNRFCGVACASIANAAIGARKKHESSWGYDVSENGCWLWRTQNRRYPHFTLGGRYVSAHVYFWEQANGPVPEGCEIHHTCENTRCVNPAHLKAVTSTVHGRTHRAKLNEDAVRIIRASTERTSVIARAFGVSAPTICDIRSGRTWGEVE